MKKILNLVLILAVMLSLCVTSFAQASAAITQVRSNDIITITVDGNAVDCAKYGQMPVIVEGRTLVPLRSVFEALGASVNWDNDTRSAVSVKGAVTVILTIDSKELKVNGTVKELDVPAQIMNERTVVPVRAVAEAFGCNVEWNNDTRTVVIVTGAVGEEVGSEEAADRDETYTIGICQLTQHDALDAATQGFVDVLTEKLGDKVSFDILVAAGDSFVCSTIANKFVADNVDLIMANATAALQAAAKASFEIPILGTSITEYGVALGIENFTGVVGGNISGTSDLAPLDRQAAMLKELFPEAEKVALLYCSAEVNSKFQVVEVAEYLAEMGVETQEFAYADSNDLAAITEAACAYADVIYVPTDNTAASSAGVIDGICRPKKMPIIAGEAGICSGCGVATLSIDYYKLGKVTGEQAYRILVEGEDVNTMPIEYDQDVVKKYNAEICAELGITVPEDYVVIE